MFPQNECILAPKLLGEKFWYRSMGNQYGKVVPIEDPLGAKAIKFLRERYRGAWPALALNILLWKQTTSFLIAWSNSRLKVLNLFPLGSRSSQIFFHIIASRS